MNLAIALFLIVFEAVPEALASIGKKTFAGVLEFVYRAVVALVLFAVACGFQYNGTMDNYFYYLGGYVLVRFALFDYLYNVIANLPMFRSGTTKIYDKLMSKVPWHLLGFIRAIALWIGIVWLLK